uniref:PQQ-binding-like beta-propeller repeat protein n=1 Tax=Streptomyces xantholiticus TaxID=68285 RepID=UPI0035714395
MRCAAVTLTVVDGMLYVGCDDKQVYALALRTAGHSSRGFWKSPNGPASATTDPQPLYPDMMAS